MTGESARLALTMGECKVFLLGLGEFFIIVCLLLGRRNTLSLNVSSDH